jgi:hypothetical protein
MPSIQPEMKVPVSRIMGILPMLQVMQILTRRCGGSGPALRLTRLEVKCPNASALSTAFGVFNPVASIVIFAFCVLSLGCTATVTPPANPHHPVAIYVADYGHHSSIFLPVDKTAFIEYSFGDWNYYALNHSSTMGAIEALFYSHGSAFGRRYTPRSSDDNTPLALFNPKMFAVCVSRESAEKMRNQLEAKWQAGVATRIHNADDDTDFIRDSRHYSWQCDCNEITACLLRDLGCEVEGATYLSHFRLSDDALGTMVYCE